jgi:UDP-N-acetyl-2-amino-2-deoxyglucuronate dehydrogenase
VVKTKPNNFALIGAAGYIAPRHMKAIADTGNQLIAMLDKYDGVGVVDKFFPGAEFFTEPERFDRHLDRLRRQRDYNIDYVSICSPNYLHDSHIRLALRNGADAICEKPIVLNPWNLDALAEIEQENKKKIFNILQLRYHPSIVQLKEEIEKGPPGKVYDIDLAYITSRGRWYFRSWKGDISKSGGIATNIGVHFFDMLSWIFGKPRQNIVHLLQEDKAAGFLLLEKARVRWFLSLDEASIPPKNREAGQRTYRSLIMGGKEIEFSEGFTDLHTVTYKNILDGNGFGIEDARPSIEMVYTIRNFKPIGLKGDYHPFLKKLKP